MLKIIKTNTKKPFCIFYKNPLIGNRCIEINVSSFGGGKHRFHNFVYQIHLSCGYNFIKKLNKPSIEEEKMLNLLEKKYTKQMICECLENEGKK